MNYSGMTVNERLVVSGLDKEFDRAIKNKDAEKLVKILKEICKSPIYPTIQN